MGWHTPRIGFERDDSSLKQFRNAKQPFAIAHVPSLRVNSGIKQPGKILFHLVVVSFLQEFVNIGFCLPPSFSRIDSLVGTNNLLQGVPVDVEILVKPSPNEIIEVAVQELAIVGPEGIRPNLFSDEGWFGSPRTRACPCRMNSLKDVAQPPFFA